MRVLALASLLFGVLILSSPTLAQGLAIPRAQDRPPGPPLSAEEAVKKMTVPEGFTVEIVASEPQIMNPVAMCIDEQGRFWVTESFEYPRREAGPGRDRIKVLEDTDQNGKVDKVTIFAEGLNIPSGINVGHGGVWVCNAPDLLFMQDTDGDLKADKTSVLLTGWGRDDTHELPNSLTWGPDGWLYGLNGVFNFSHVKYGKDNPNLAKNPDHPGWPLTCALWRINPHTKEFDIFAEGTSNPWGIAINDEGEFFLSACVIDHLWHITQSGYYIRQGGPYPPHTWPIGSIVQHKHQKAAYCGITWFDSDAYPEEYRKVFYMGNIHGGCINADITEPHGSTYKGKPHPGFPAKPGTWAADVDGNLRKEGTPEKTILKDLLTANDAWFMPVVQKVGPDGCLYILDWYDRYHCYQDANADPAGIEREKGRLYRLRYKQTPRAPKFDLAKETDEQLIERLTVGTNDYIRSTAGRVLCERANPNTQKALIRLALDRERPQSARLQALWTAHSIGKIEPGVLWGILAHRDEAPSLKAWSTRILGNQLDLTDHLFFESPSDPVTELQGIIAWTKSASPRRGLETAVVLQIMRHHPTDETIHHIGWNAIQDFLTIDPEGTSTELADQVIDQGVYSPGELRSYVNAMDSMFDHPKGMGGLRYLAERACDSETSAELRKRVLQVLARRLREQGPTHERQVALQKSLQQPIRQLTKSDDAIVANHAILIAALWGDAEAHEWLKAVYYDVSLTQQRRIEALQTLIAAGKAEVVLHAVSDTINASGPSAIGFRIGVIESLGAINDEKVGPMVAELLVDNLTEWEPEVQPKALEVLTQRPAWSKPLLVDIEAKKISKDALNLNQLRRMASFKDEAFAKQFKTLYGTIREGRNPDREGVINFTRDFLKGTPGDAERGIAVYKKVCAQCHKMYGEGAEVGPDITLSGRNNWDQLLTNVLDPSLVIGGAYQARILQTADGRVLTGLPVEETEQRVVLKVQGGKLETIPRDQIEVYKVSEISMMPEQLEKQITPQELADLFSYLALDKPPSDPKAKYLPGYPRGK